MRLSLRPHLVLLFPLLTLACSGPVDSVDTCDAGAQDEVCEVLRLVNVARADAGQPPLVWNPALAEAAQAHAEDMVTNGYFSHASQDGRSFSTRARDAGYDAFPSGENIASGYPTPEAVMAGWIDSDGHRRNILSAGSNEIGVGLESNVWVQVFGKR